ncbi:MAG: hypothetical protein R3A52_27030 [Polyangiales bacterium]
MRGRSPRALWLGLVALGCVRPWALDPTVQARVAPVGLRALPGNAVQIADWVLTGWTPPVLTRRPPSDGVSAIEVRSTLSMRDPRGGAWSGDCLFAGRSGSVATRSQSSMTCDFDGPDGRQRLLLYGYGEPDFFALSRVTGNARGPSARWSALPPPEPGEPAERAHDRVELDGTPRALNVYRSREVARYSTGAWRSACCATLDAVAAITTRNPEAVWVVPELEWSLRVMVMLTAGALVSVRDVVAAPVVE